MNLAREIKRHLDVFDSEEMKVVDFKIQLLHFFDCISLVDCFENVDKSDFAKIKERSKSQKRQKKQLNVFCLNRFETMSVISAKTDTDNSNVL